MSLLLWSRVGLVIANGGKLYGGSSQKTSLPEFRQYKGDSGVPGGQLPLDLIASHNQAFPDQNVSITDLKTNNDPNFQCRGTGPLKNGYLICGCFVRSEAPDPLTHKEVPALIICQMRG